MKDSLYALTQRGIKPVFERPFPWSIASALPCGVSWWRWRNFPWPFGLPPGSSSPLKNCFGEAVNGEGKLQPVW